MPINLENQLANIKALVKACDNLNLSYEYFDNYGNLVRVTKNDKHFYFINTKLPLNDLSTFTLFRDKDFSYRILDKEMIDGQKIIPKSKGYINPDCEEENKKFLQFKNWKEILEDIEKNFNLPVVVKMNRGSQGLNVFFCETLKDIKKKMKMIFNPKRKNYDYLAVVQEWIDIKKEYRVIWFRGEMILLYSKESEVKNQSLSPLHNDGSKTVVVEDEKEKKEITDFISKIEILKDFEWVAIDLAKDSNGRLFIIELNNSPQFNYFVRDCGDELLISMYEKILKSL